EEYISASKSSNEDPNRVFLKDITIMTNNDKSKDPKKEKDQEKEVGYGIILQNYLLIMDPKAKQVDKALVEFIITNSQPFYLLKNLGFVKYLMALGP
ncbi:100_t:CDS:2, partial [Racocetra persica]